MNKTNKQLGVVGRLHNGLTLLCCWNGLWLLLLFVGIGIYFIGMPKYADDYWYMQPLKPWFESQGILYPEDGGNILTHGFPWSGVYETWKIHFLTDNTRMGNILGTLLLIFPKWVGGGFVWLMFIASVFGAFRIAEIDWRKSPLVPIGVFMWTFLMPWRESMGSVIYPMNYVFPCALAIFTILLMWKHKNTWPMAAGALVLGFLTGWGHEGFSVPLICGLIVVSCFKKEFRDKVSVAAMTGIVLGIILLFISPGMRSRAGQDGGSFYFWFFHSYDFNFTALPFGLLLVTWLVTLFRKGGIRRCFDWRVVLIIISTTVCLGIVACTGISYRGGYWAMFASPIAMLWLFRANWRGYFDRYRLSWAIVSFLLLGTAFAHWAVTDYISLYDRKLMRAAFEDYTTGKTSQPFGKVMTLRSIPLIGGYECAELCGYALFRAGEYYEGRGLAIVPEELKYVTPDSGRDIGAGVRELSGYLFTEADKDRDPEDIKSLYADFGKGFVRVPIFVYPFNSQVDGKDYWYIYPCTDWYVTHFKTMRRVDRYE